jgi:hypothetical protein
MQLFIRVRGRVLGPFDEQKLRSLASRGQFGKMHEVSEDGVAWGHASQYSDLFRPSELAVVAVESAGDQEQRQESGGHVVVTKSPPNSSQSNNIVDWYYNSDGREEGPVTLAILQAMIRSGELSLHVPVWTSGMNHWLPASKVDSLAVASVSPPATAGQHSNGVVSQLDEIRPWITVFAVMWTIASVGSVIGGVLFLIQAAKTSEISKPAASIFALQSIGWFLEGIVATVTSVMLFALAGEIREFVFHCNDAALQKVLKKGKQLIVFWGVLTIIVIAFAIIATIYLMAVN